LRQTDHPEEVAAIDHVRIESESLGKACGMVIGAVEEPKFWADRGFYFFFGFKVSAMV
jgi:hypothetical protein